MWFIGVEVEQETSAPLPKKILDPPLRHPSWIKATSSDTVRTDDNERSPAALVVGFTASSLQISLDFLN